MKKIIPFLLLITGQCFAQNGLTSFAIGNSSITAEYRPFIGSGTLTLGQFGQALNWPSNTDKQELITSYDTSVLFKGIDTVLHEHDFLNKDVRTGFVGNISCCVNHGLSGCPDTWMREDEICSICLKNIIVQERRWVKVTKVVDRYAEAKAKLAKITGK